MKIYTCIFFNKTNEFLLYFNVVLKMSHKVESNKSNCILIQINYFVDVTIILYIRYKGNYTQIFIIFA